MVKFELTMLYISLGSKLISLFVGAYIISSSLKHQHYYYILKNELLHPITRNTAHIGQAPSGYWISLPQQLQGGRSRRSRKARIQQLLQYLSPKPKSHSFG